MDLTHIKAWWIGISGLGALIGATTAVALFPDAAFGENPTGQFGWHLVGFALSIGSCFALGQWMLLQKALANRRTMGVSLSVSWLIVSTAGIVTILFPLWWLRWGQVLLAPHWTVSLMFPGSLVLGIGQRLVLGRFGESTNRYILLTCFGVAIGGYLGLIGAILLLNMTLGLLPVDHGWALLFGLIVGAFQCRPLERTIKSVAVDESS
jgi:hypothetical protein